MTKRTLTLGLVGFVMMELVFLGYGVGRALTCWSLFNQATHMIIPSLAEWVKTSPACR